DLFLVDFPRDLLLSRRIDRADLLQRNRSARAVILGNLAGNGNVFVDYQENVLAGLRTHANAHQQQRNQTHSRPNTSKLEPVVVRDAAPMTTRRFCRSHYPTAPPGPLVIIHTKHPGAWEIEVFYAADL